MSKNSNAIVNYEYYKKSNALNSLDGESFSKPSHELLIGFLMSIDPNKPPQEEVRLYIKDYKALFDTGRKSITYLNKITDELGGKRFKLYNDKGILTSISLFDLVTVERDQNGDLYFLFIPCKTAHPYFFEIASNYTRYSLKAILGLNKLQHRLLYETLRGHIYQKENTATFQIPYSLLLQRLGCKIKEYRNFKTAVLEEAKQAFDENKDSDIRFTYEKVCGAHGKVTDIKFYITKKILDIETVAISQTEEPPKLEETDKPLEQPPKYIDKDEISHIFEPDRDFIDEEVIKYYGNERNAEIARSVQYEFSKDEIDEIVLLMTDLHIDIAPDDEEILLVGRSAAEWSKKEKYIRRLYSKLQSSVKRYKVKNDNRARYFIKMLENAIKEMAKISTTSEENPSNKKTSYDLDEWEKFADSYIANYYNKKHETDSTSE